MPKHQPTYEETIDRIIADLRGDPDSFDADFDELFDRRERERPDPIRMGDARYKSGVISKVTDDLFLGDDDYLHRSDLQKQMEDVGITHVLDCRTWEEVDHSKGWRHPSRRYVDPTERFIVAYNATGDDGRVKSTDYFLAAIQWADEVLRNGGKIYAHCAMGINRGPSNLYAIMRATNPRLDTVTTLSMIRRARPFAGVMYWRDADDAIEELYGR